MNKIIIALCIIFILTNTLYAQKITEFEGVITYAHTVTATSAGYDAARDYEYIGKKSEFYYKAGKYKWLNENAFMLMDMFRSRDTVEFLQMASTDSILYVNNNYPNEKVISYDMITSGDTVLGEVCDVYIIKANAGGNDWTRCYSYNNSTLIRPSFFKNYKYNSTNFIYAAIKALPLKIEIIYDNRKITYTAISVQPKKIQDIFFEFSADTKFKHLE